MFTTMIAKPFCLAHLKSLLLEMIDQFTHMKQHKRMAWSSTLASRVRARWATPLLITSQTLTQNDQLLHYDHTCQLNDHTNIKKWTCTFAWCRQWENRSYLRYNVCTERAMYLLPRGTQNCYGLKMSKLADSDTVFPSKHMYSVVGGYIQGCGGGASALEWNPTTHTDQWSS